MITAEDLALAQTLLAEKSVDPGELERALASMGGENSGKTLKEVLTGLGFLKPGAAMLGATLIPGEPVEAPAAPVNVVPPERFDQTRIAAASASRPPVTPAAAPVPQGTRTVRRIGRFEVVDELARGGMGIVYRAWEASLNRHVALKVLIAGESASEDQVQRFLREAQAAAGLQHPNIVPVYEVGQDAGSHWFAMELVDGPSLDKLMKEQGAFPPRTALRIGRDIARALHFAHQKGIVHRDVKPGNIMVASVGRAATSSASGETRPMRVLLGDFGLARDASAGSGLTLSGNLLGTPAYMSPEQAAGRTKEVDAQSDIFGLGAVLYELLCGKTPFQAESLGEVLTAIIGSEPPPLRKMRPGLHRDIELIVQKAMAKDKNRRYATAGELADDLDRYLNGEEIHAEAPSMFYRLARWGRTHAAAAVAVTVVAAVIVSGGGLWWRKRVEHRGDEIRRAEAARQDLFNKTGAALAAARDLAGRAEFSEAFLRIGTARSMAPGDVRVEETDRDVRRLRLVHDVGAIARLSDPGEGELATARSLLAMSPEFRREPEVVRLTREIEGTCSWAVETAEQGIEVDLLEAEPDILWDEETFPSIAAARDAGICRLVGPAPLSPRDIPFGEYVAVFSRAGKVLRVVPVQLKRNKSIVLEYRVLRVGRSAEAGYRRLEDALAAALPGATVLIEEGGLGSFSVVARPGLLIAAAPGAHPIVRNPQGGGISVSDSYGLRIRDIGIVSAGQMLSASGSPRISLIRCGGSTPASSGINLNDCEAWQVRDSSFAALPHTFAFSLGSTTGGLVLRTSFEGGGFSNGTAGGDHLRFVRCLFARGDLAGIHVVGRNHEFRECEFRDEPNWGIICDKAPEHTLITDNVFINCGTFRSSPYHGAIAHSGGGGQVEHNTFIGGAFTALTFVGPGRVADNLFMAVTAFASDGHQWPGGAIVLRDKAGAPCMEGNAVWGCEVAGRVQGKDCKTVEDFAVEATIYGCPAGASPPLRLLDPGTLGADGRLPDDSPARNAATDGTDIGARREMLLREAPTSEAWIVRDIARTWARRGREALEKNDRPAAGAYLRNARLMAPADPAVIDLAETLK